MPSPFPGMDPYIEQPALWPGFHTLLATEILRQIKAGLPHNYIVSLEPRIEISVEAKDIAVFLPDIAVTERPRSAGKQTGPAIAAAPLEIPTVGGERVKVAAVYVYQMPEERLVTVIEILSPINKQPGNAAYNAYLIKRNMLLSVPIHLLEIDLLRAGRRVPMAEALPSAPYFIFLSRADRRPISEVWPIQLTASLPVVPVPLLDGDPDVPLDLQKAVAETYELAGCDRRIDYTQPPPGPLTDAEAAWVKQLLKLQL